MHSWSKLLNYEYYEPFFANGIRIAVIVALAYLATALLSRLVRGVQKYSVRMMERAGGGPNFEFELEKRARTITGVVRGSLAVLIWTLAFFMVLKEMRFDIEPLLAGAGVVGVAVGFGAQNIIKDVLSGLFMLMENQLRVNDVAVVNGKGGLVEEINLRTTILRSEDGAVHIFQNGSITALSNLTREFSYYVFTTSVGYRENTDQVVDVLKAIGAELMTEEPYKSVILAPLEVMGVDQLGDAAVQIKSRFKTIAMQQWTVGREMNRRIKMKFQEANIEIPFPSQTIQIAPGLPEHLRGELKQIVREVLREPSGVRPTDGRG
jgi:moderate conductance mechanosensitive channel